MQPTPATDKTGFSHFTSYWQAYCSCIKSSTEKLNLYIALKTAPKATTTHITVSWLLGKCCRIIPQKLVVQAVLDSSRRERRAKSFTIWIHYQWNRRWSTPSAKKSFTTSWMEWFLVYGVYIIIFLEVFTWFSMQVEVARFNVYENVFEAIWHSCRLWDSSGRRTDDWC